MDHVCYQAQGLCWGAFESQPMIIPDLQQLLTEINTLRRPPLARMLLCTPMWNINKSVWLLFCFISLETGRGKRLKWFYMAFIMPKSREWFTFLHATCFPAEKWWWTVFLKQQPHWLPSQMRYDSAHLKYTCSLLAKMYNKRMVILHLFSPHIFCSHLWFLFPKTLSLCF